MKEFTSHACDAQTIRLLLRLLDTERRRADARERLVLLARLDEVMRACIVLGNYAESTEHVCIWYMTRYSTEYVKMDDETRTETEMTYREKSVPQSQRYSRVPQILE
jgi:hypothetical protein